jgi:hypothetical protein
MSEIKSTGIYAFKWVQAGGIVEGGGSKYRYDLPKDGFPGDWHSKNKSRRSIRVCGHGFHCVPFNSIQKYLHYGPELYMVEISGKFSSDGDKIAVESIRFINRIEYECDRSIGRLEVPTPKERHLGQCLNTQGVLGVNPVGTILTYI